MARRLCIGLVVVAVSLVVSTTQARATTTYYQAVQASGVSANGTWDVFLNPAGQVTSVNCGGECDGPRGFVWSESTGSFADVGPLMGCIFEDCFYTATSINGSNQVSGWIQGKTANCLSDQAYRLNIATDKYALMPCKSEAYLVNAAGQLVGGYQNSQGSERAFLWDGTTFKDLGTLGGAQAFATGSAATGQAVGCSQTKAGTWHPFLYKNGSRTRPRPPNRLLQRLRLLDQRQRPRPRRRRHHSTNQLRPRGVWRVPALDTLSDRQVHDHQAAHGYVLHQRRTYRSERRGRALRRILRHWL